jgi:hypothetical protein
MSFPSPSCRTTVEVRLVRLIGEGQGETVTSVALPAQERKRLLLLFRLMYQ